MSTQSGITCTAELIDSFKKYIDSSARCFIIKIENEKLVPGQSIKGTSSMDEDWEEIREALSETEPAFVVVNRDDSEEHVFISYTPDYANVRSKMIYASSKSTLLRELGLEFFKPLIFVTELDEISADNWKQHLVHADAQTPLTVQEHSLQQIKDFENLNVGTDRRKNKLVNDSASSFIFAIEGDLKQKLHDISDGELVSCAISLSDETIKMSQDSSFKTPQEAIDLIATTEPQYTLLKYNTQVNFIYSCPSGSKVKDRMVYASNKNGFVNQVLKKELDLNISNIIEVGDLDEVEMSIFETLDEKESPTTSETSSTSSRNLKFSKPKGPRRR